MHEALAGSWDAGTGDSLGEIEGSRFSGHKSYQEEPFAARGHDLVVWLLSVQCQASPEASVSTSGSPGAGNETIQCHEFTLLPMLLKGCPGADNRFYLFSGFCYTFGGVLFPLLRSSTKYLWLSIVLWKQIHIKFNLTALCHENHSWWLQEVAQKNR